MVWALMWLDDVVVFGVGGIIVMGFGVICLLLQASVL